MISKFTLLIYNYQYVSCFFSRYFKKVDIMLVSQPPSGKPMLNYSNL